MENIIEKVKIENIEILDINYKENKDRIVFILRVSESLPKANEISMNFIKVKIIKIDDLNEYMSKMNVFKKILSFKEKLDLYNYDHYKTFIEDRRANIILYLTKKGLEAEMKEFENQSSQKQLQSNLSVKKKRETINSIFFENEGFTSIIKSKISEIKSNIDKSINTEKAVSHLKSIKLLVKRESPKLLDMLYNY